MTVRVAPAPAPLACTEPLTGATRQRMVNDARRRLLRNSPIATSLALAAVAAVASLVLAWVFNDDPAVIIVWAVAGTIGFAAFIWWVLSPLVVRVGMLVMARAGWIVGYFDHTATQLVHPRHGGWELSDHHAVVQGVGIARPFRRRVFTHLAGEADRHRVVITMSTQVPKLVDIYLADMPGLRLIGTKRSLFGTIYLLRRDPADTPVDPTHAPSGPCATTG